jgi:tripartite-type tricarboxylate transporter receptor subunit TctC
MTRVFDQLSEGGTMKLWWRTLLPFAVAAVVAPALSPVAPAQTYPTRPITVIVPAPAGGPTDVVGRVVAERMRVSLGQPVIIENVSGADGSIGTGRAARARPDGYTIEIGYRGTHVLNGAFYSLSYDVVNDFAPISPLVTTPGVFFASKNVAANDLREWIAWLKANPGKASVGIYTVGLRLIMAVFQKETETRFALVPYRGVAPAMQDLLAGQIDIVPGSPDQLPLVRTGRIKALAVTGDTRLALAPDVPTVAEIGLPAFGSIGGWLGFFAPRSTPKDVISKLNAATVEALANPSVRARIADFGMEIFPREEQTPEALAAIVRADAEKWLPLITEFGIKAE